MAEGSGDSRSGGIPMTLAPHDPSKYVSLQARQRFAVAKYYGMGSDGEWTVVEIADALDVSERTVYKYLNDSDIAEEVREVLAVTEAEWRLDMALQLRREVKRLEEIEQGLLQEKKRITTGWEDKTVTGAPTGDHNIRLDEDHETYRLKIPVPTQFETVTDYGPDLERVQKEKRQYLEQIAKLLGLNDSDRRTVDEALAAKHDDVKIVEIRRVDDEYPEPEVIDIGAAEAVDGEDGDDEQGADDGAEHGRDGRESGASDGQGDRAGGPDGAA